LTIDYKSLGNTNDNRKQCHTKAFDNENIDMKAKGISALCQENIEVAKARL